MSEAITPGTPEGERRLAELLAALVNQIDINDYRDSKGHAAKNNLAFLQAQGIVDHYGFSHDDICTALDECGEDLAAAAAKLSRCSGPQTAQLEEDEAAGFSPPAG